MRLPVRRIKKREDLIEMKRGRRKRLAPLGLLSIALLLALCLAGVGYAAWTDEVYIEGTVDMGYVAVVLSAGDCSHPEIISCSVSDPHTLVVTLTDAPPGDYACNFTIENTGTIPVKIQDIFKSGVPNGVDVYVSGVTKGTQIEQDGVDPDSFEGAMLVTVPEGCEVTDSFEIAFSFVQWNLYVE